MERASGPCPPETEAAAAPGTEEAAESASGPAESLPTRDSVMASYGATVEVRHPNSLWRRDLVYKASGLRLEVRPITPDDDVRETEFFNAMTVRERVLRFMGAKNTLLPQEVRNLTHLDFDRDFAIVAVDRKTDSLVAIARYCRELDNPEMAEAAVAVLQRYQRLGVGQYLVSALFDAAKAYGVKTLIADILRENTASRRLFDKVAERAGAQRRLEQADFDVYTYHYILPEVNAWAPHEVKVAESKDNPDTGQLQTAAFTVDDSRHPRSLWRHDLIFQSGLRVDVRPADPDDKVRVSHFTQKVADTGGAPEVTDLARIDFTNGFALVGVDAAKDELAGAAHFQRSSEGLRLSVLTAPDYRGLGIADFLSMEVLRAAEREVMAHEKVASL